MSKIKIHSEPIVSGDSNRRYVRNVKPVDLERDHKLWKKGDLIEVSKEESMQLHDDGFLVLDEDDLEIEKQEAEKKLQIEVKE